MPGSWPKTAIWTPESATIGREAAIAGLAAAQHGVVSLAQLGVVALSGRAVRDRVAAGRLHRVHNGVYAVGHPLLTQRGRWMAAVLACGPGAVLSHRSAANLWRLVEGGPARSELISAKRSGRSRGGLRIRSGLPLLVRERTIFDGIPCTTVARTLFDLAGVVDRRTLERACERAEAARLFDLAAVQEIVRRASCRRGRPAMRDVLADYLPAPLTRSELEERFLALCLDAGIPRPQVNAWMRLEGDYVQADFLWRDQRLVVETDGRATHDTAAAFERDRLRDQRLMLAGWRVVRFTWRQVVDHPEQVACTVRALLADGRRVA